MWYVDKSFSKLYYINNYSLLVLKNYKNVWLEHLQIPKHFQTFLRLWCRNFRNYSSNHISKVYKAPSQSATRRGFYQKYFLWFFIMIFYIFFFKKKFSPAHVNIFVPSLFSKGKLPEILGKHFPSRHLPAQS